MKKSLSILLSLVFTIAAFLYAFWDVELDAVLQVFFRGTLAILIPLLLLVGIFFIVTGWRWTWMLKPFGHYRLRDVAPAMMIGFAGNNLLPLRLGEFLRAVLFANRFHLPKSGILMTLVLERFLDVLGILVIYVVAVLYTQTLPPALRMTASIVAAGLGLLTVGVFVFLRFPDFFIKAWHGIARHLNDSIRERGHAYLIHADTGLHSLRSKRTILVLIAYSLFKWMIAGAMVWLSLYSYGVSISPGLSMVVVAVTALAVALPGAPGFFGAIQAAFVFALVPFGISQEVALASSILFLLSQWVPSTLVGGLYFISNRLSVQAIKK